MKKLTLFLASLLICVSILSSFPVVYADEIGTTVPPEETTQQETTPPEDEALPLSWNPQPDEVNY